MGNILKSAHELLGEENLRVITKQRTEIKRQISKALKEMDIQDLALVNKLIIHRKQVQRYFELHKLLGRQLG